VDRLNRQLTLLSVVLLAVVAFLSLDWDRAESEQQVDEDAPPSRALFAYKPEAIVKVSLVQPDRTLKFEQHEGAWQMVEPVSTLAQASALTSIVERFESLRVEEKALPGKAEDYGLDEAHRVELRLEELDGTAYTVYIGLDTPVGYKTYVQVVGDDAVHTLNSKVRDLVDKAPDEFRGRDLLSFEPSSADRVRIVTSTHEVVYRKDETGWWVGDTGPRASDQQVGDYLSIVSTMKVAGFLDGRTPAELGLESPAATVSVKDASGTHTLRVGPQGADGADAAAGDIPVRVSAADLAVLLPPETWSSPRLVEAKSWKVDGVTIELGDKKLVLTRKAGSWKDAEGNDAPDASAVVDALLDLPVDRSGTATMAGDGGRVVVSLGEQKVVVKLGDPNRDGARVAREEAGGPAFLVPAASLQVLDDAVNGKLKAAAPAAHGGDDHGGGMPPGLEELLKGMDDGAPR
jgi:hypothetical protein